MASLSRHRPAHVAQGTWRSGALHVWGWNGIDAAPMAWLYSGFRHLDVNGLRTGWHDTPVSYGAIGRLSLDIDERPALHASSVQLDAMGTAVWLSELPEPEFLSDSLAWFARAAELARRTVSAGRITPVIADEGPFTVARWKPVTDESIDATIVALDASMPAICTAGSGVDAAVIYSQLVDGIARAFLFQYGWKADLGRQRKPEVQVLRATFAALAKPDHVVRGGTDEFDDALRQLRDELDRHQRRLAGEPVVVPRIRLVISDDPGDPWIVRLELVDDRDSARWCTANDVWDANRHRRRGRQGRPAPRPAARAHRRHRRPGQGDPRARRTRPRTRADAGRTRTRRRRGLPRHRPGRAAADGCRADRARAVDPHPSEHQRRSNALPR